MLTRIRKAAENKDSGFTLIELLVVMIIIGILAAIAIPAFLSQKNKARSTSAKADATTIGKEVASYFVDGTKPASPADFTPGGTTAAPTWSVASMTGLSGKLSGGNSVSGKVTDSEHWCVTVWNTDVETSAATPGKSTWSYSFERGLEQGSTCAPAAPAPAPGP